MSSEHDYEGRMDFLEILITTLREHEKKLSEVADGFEKTAGDLIEALKKVQSLPKVAPDVLVQCSDWEEFKREVKAAYFATFSFKDNRFIVSALSNEILYVYSELLPEREFRARKEGERYILDGIFIDSLDTAHLTFNKSLNCGLTGTFITSTHLLNDGTYALKITLHMDSDQAREWISRELGIPSSKVLQGSISL